VLAGIGSIFGAVIVARAASAQTSCPPDQLPNRKGDCSCPAGTDPCPDCCFNKKKDSANCGQCGNACAAGGICVKGDCRCLEGQIVADGSCCSPTNGQCTGNDDCCGDGFCFREHCVLIPPSTEPAPI